MTERQLHELRERWDKAHSRWSSIGRAMEELRAIEYELRGECERLAELIAEHDDTEIVITDDDGEIS